MRDSLLKERDVLDRNGGGRGNGVAEAEAPRLINELSARNLYSSAHAAQSLQRGQAPRRWWRVSGCFLMKNINISPDPEVRQVRPGAGS